MHLLQPFHSISCEDLLYYNRFRLANKNGKSVGCCVLNLRLVCSQIESIILPRIIELLLEREDGVIRYEDGYASHGYGIESSRCPTRNTSGCQTEFGIIQSHQIVIDFGGYDIQFVGVLPIGSFATQHPSD